MKWMIVTLAVIPLDMRAQWDRLCTDRPDLTEATMTVPMGAVQVEMGTALFPHPEGGADLNTPQLLVRLGLGERVEFHAEGERAQTTTKDGEQRTAWTAPGLGAKVGMGEGGNTGIRTAMLVKVGIPQWSENKEGDPFAGIRLAADRDFGERWGLGTNVAMVWNGLSTVATPLYTFSGGTELSRKIAVFWEVYGAWPEDGTGDHRWDCGGTWAFGPNTLADASLGNGFAGQGWFFSAGFSFRVQCWRKKDL